jgi:hypothetical protein
MRIVLKTLIILVVLAFQGCVPKEELGEEALARLNGEVLLVSDIADQLPKAGTMAPADSVALVDRLVRDWARDRLLIQAAEFNLSDEAVAFKELVERYRNDLLKHAYMERFVSDHLDTNISQEEIESYYQGNLSNFELKESIVQGRYIAAPLAAQKVEKAKSWFKKDPSDEDFLDWAEVFASKQSSFGDSSWIPLDEFLQDIPLDVNNPFAYLSRNTRFTCEDTLLVYFVEIQDLKVKDSYSPIGYVEGKIKNVILNKRRLQLIARTEEKIINDAIEEGKLILN